jgi:hypothetical protein
LKNCERAKRTLSIAIATLPADPRGRPVLQTVQACRLELVTRLADAVDRTDQEVWLLLFVYRHPILP